MSVEQSTGYYTQDARHADPPMASPWGPWSRIGANQLAYDNFKEKISVSTLGYRKLKRAELPLHPYTKNEYEYRSGRTIVGVNSYFPDGRWARDEYRGSTEIAGVNAHADPRFFPDIYAIDNRALAKLFDKTSLSEGSAAVTGAELHKTAKMIGDTARTLAKAYKALRQGKLGTFADTLGITVSRRRAQALRRKFTQQREYTGDTRQFAAQTWLAFSYGWKPLISDIYSQAENLANYYERRSCVVREATGSAKETKVTDEVVSVAGYWKNTRSAEVTSKVKYVVRYTIPDGAQTIDNVFGLNRPALVAWELMPFSFVVDWFLPIGNFLEQLNATDGLSFHSGTRSVLHTTLIECEVVADKARSGTGGMIYTQDVVSGGFAFQKKREKSRQVLFSFPQARLPTWKSPVSIAHALSGLALLQAVFHGGVKSYQR